MEIKIKDMSCSSCAKTIENRLKKHSGVQKLNVNFATDNVEIEFDSNKTTLKEIYTKIKETGYTPLKKTATIEIEDMSCENCAKTIKKELENEINVLKTRVNYATDEAQITYNPMDLDRDNLIKIIEKTGYEVKKEEKETEITQKTKKLKKTIFGAILAIPLFLLMIGHMFFANQVPETLIGLEIGWIQFILATPIQIVLGHKFYKNSYKAIYVNKTANMDVLIALGSTTAYLYSLFVLAQLVPGNLYFDSAAFILVFITLGNYLEEKSKSRANNAIRELIKLSPDTATKINEQGEEKEISQKDIQVGDLLKVRPGEKIPTDGLVKKGKSSVDESMVTGESVPIEKKPGEEVIGSTINKNGSLIIEATKVGEKTALQQIIKLVKKAQSQQPSIQRLADKISAYFVPAVIMNAVFWAIFWFLFPKNLSALVEAFSLWGLIEGGPELVGGTVSSLEFSIIVFASAVLVACPCALGLATPAATMMGSSIGAKNGILIKGGDILEKVKGIDLVVFDKTGTLTEGEMRVTDIVPIKPDVSEKIVLKKAATAEANSEHPLAKSIIKEAKNRDIEYSEPKEFDNEPGKGVLAKKNNEKIIVGNENLIKQLGINLTKKDVINGLKEEGKTIMYVAINDEVIGMIVQRDKIKKDAKKSIEKLNKLDKQILIITGDNQITAKSVANEIGINKDNIYAEVLPDEKTNVIKKLQKESDVMMVGDGVNDAPALATAEVGVAIGSGTDVAIESADIILMKNELMDVVKSFNLSEATISKIKQNLFWALGYNSAMIPLASLGLMRPSLAAAAMAFSSVSVLMNSLLFKNYDPSKVYSFFGLS